MRMRISSHLLRKVKNAGVRFDLQLSCSLLHKWLAK